ncbi:ankyrin repeat-containing protein [Forsythia ovata]|uniref:Ankyrin repeat-containing protein n=1 Tax=Forsythia ovata TaxID=205694 RepID=A0ABD1SKX9_9LAMI
MAFLPLNAGDGDSFLTVGSYNPSEFSSPAATEDFSEEQLPLYLGKYLIYVIVSLLLAYRSIDVNVINNKRETAMDIADKLQYGASALEIKEALVEAGAKHARHVGQVDKVMELKRTVSDIKHEVHSQLIQNKKTQRQVSGIAKELKKIHRDAVQNTTNSVTVVAVLFASIAFLAIFNLPGLYLRDGPKAGKARISNTIAFRVFYLSILWPCSFLLLLSSFRLPRFLGYESSETSRLSCEQTNVGCLH